MDQDSDKEEEEQDHGIIIKVVVVALKINHTNIQTFNIIITIIISFCLSSLVYVSINHDQFDKIVLIIEILRSWYVCDEFDEILVIV